jgi:hypothetical protein
VTVTVEEVLTPATIGSSASGSVSIATSLLSTDLVLIVMSKGNAGTTTVTINGSAAPAYSNWQNGTGTRVYVYSKTGITGSHSVGYTTSSTASATFTIMVIRGLTNSAITASAISDWSSSSTAANTDEGPASQSAGLGQIAVYAATPAAGTPTFPSNPTPSGWTTDRTAVALFHGVAHYIPTSSVSVQSFIRTTSITTLGSVMLIVGDVSSVPELTSTFVGWGNPIF